MSVRLCGGSIFFIIASLGLVNLFACGGKKYNSNDGDVVLSTSFDLIPNARLAPVVVETQDILEDVCLNVTDFDYQNAGISMESYPKIDVQQYKQYFSRKGKFDFYIHPIICDNKVYDIKTDGEIVAYELSDGMVRKKWSRNTLTKNETINVLISQARLEEGVFYLATGNGYVLAFNEEKQEILWKQKFNTMFASSPTIYNDALYLISNDDDVYAIDKNSGKLLWQAFGGLQNSKKSFQIPPVAVFKGKIVAGLSNGFVLVLNEDGKLLWKNKIVSAKSSEDDIKDIDFPPILFNNVLVAGGIRNGVVGFDFDTGQPLWQIPTGLNSYILFNRQGFGFFVNDKNENVCFEITSGLIKWVKSQKQVVNHNVSGYLNNGESLLTENINRYFDAY